ncbi:hypothetical protein [Streptomyces sp. NPDC048650]|uniref:mycothiol-dependent nitroreductase Rv2466c family protein n=1 Tax=unclassified Streptomyces TaxID=2593676 RepID=UPI0037244570
MRHSAPSTTHWTEPDGTGREWIGDIGEALHRSDLPVELAEAGTSTDYDQDLRASHHAGVDRIDAQIGTPVLVISTPQGTERAVFGPVLHEVPDHRDSLDLWNGLTSLASVSAFHELKA